MSEVTKMSGVGKVYNVDTERMKCPVCGQEVDMLIGDDTQDGGRRGCEKCFRPSQKMPTTPAKVEEPTGNIVQDFDKHHPSGQVFTPADEPSKPVKDSPALKDLKSKLFSKGGEQNGKT